VKSNIKDIYADRPKRKGRSSHLWPGPASSTPITLAMLGDMLPAHCHAAREREARQGCYSLKPGTVLFDRTLWTANAAGQRCSAFDTVATCDLVVVMGTSLSGLTIDHVAHSAGRELGTPLLVFDRSAAPVESLRASHAWDARRDCHLQNAIDQSILELLLALHWLPELLEYLPHLCLTSLRTLRAFVQEHFEADAAAIYTDRIVTNIAHEIEREKRFYGDEDIDEGSQI